MVLDLSCSHCGTFVFYGSYYCVRVQKLVEVPTPGNALTSENSYANDNTATAVLTGIYALMSGGGFATGINSISVKAGLSADELQGTQSNALHAINAILSQQSE